MNNKIDRRSVMLGALTGATLAGLPSVASAQTSARPAAKPIQGAEWSVALADYITASPSAPISDEWIELAKLHLLDTLAAVVACRDLDAATVGRKFAQAQSAGATTSPILGTRTRATLLDAVFASAMCAHAAEINDFCPSAFVQPGASIVPAALVLGAHRKASGDAVLRSIIVGYEIACRLPKALGNRNLNAGVLANHSVGPLFGVAATCASLLRLPANRFNHLFSYCVQQASGSWQWLRDIEHIEKAFTFAGMPARRGVECALLVEAGFTGMGDPFKGDPGWLNSSLFTGPDSDFDANSLTRDLGKKSELPLVGYKKYPVGGPTQTVIEQMLTLVGRVDPKRVTKVDIAMPGRAAAFASAEMPALNLPYLCTLILLEGRLDFVGSSRVDLQACKLEYSIVSPK